MLDAGITLWAVLALMGTAGSLLALVKVHGHPARALAFSWAPLVPGVFLVGPRVVGLVPLGAPLDSQGTSLLVCGLGIPLGILAFAESTRRVRVRTGGLLLEVARASTFSSWAVASALTIVGFLHV